MRSGQLPQQYRQKNLDRSIFALWKRLVRTSEINAKLRYVQFVRSLKTFGITVFRVKEKVPGQRKLQDSLLENDAYAITTADGAKYLGA